jgi:hypothetical protein
VSSRQEEKQRRREERLARERAERASAARRQRLTLAGAVVAGAAVVVVAVLLVVGALGGGGSSDASQPQQNADVTIPEQKIGNLQAAAKAAGCKLSNPPIEGRTHENKQFTSADYKTNPPTSGAHFQDWYQDGVYEPGGTPNLGKLVHPLEHGRIEIQYKKGTPKKTVSQLETLFAQLDGGYHMLLFQNTTKMDPQIAATAWGHSLSCPQFNNQVFDAIRTFRDAYIDKGPESVP